MTMTIFLLLRALPAWLALERTERASIADKALAAAFSDESMRFRFFDAEAFSARVSDVASIETESPEAYYFAMERLRDTAFFAKPYFELVEVIPAYENGYQAFENAR